VDGVEKEPIDNPGRKRKMCESKSDAKRLKLDNAHESILHCLLILLNNVLENVDFIELRSRVSLQNFCLKCCYGLILVLCCFPFIRFLVLANQETIDSVLVNG